MIKLFRQRIIERIIAILTGLVFLNMSFFMVEVSALQLLKNKQMIENVIKLMAGAASEEEKDIFGGSENDTKDDRQIDFTYEQILSQDFSSLPFPISQRTCDGAKPISGNPEIINPPPEA